MGLEVTVPAPELPALAPLLDRLKEAGLPSLLVMVDGALCDPRVAPPASWREARLKTPAGTVTLRAQAGSVAVVVFGNADAALSAAQQTIARALAA